ncbi:MAG: hypothetical protein Q6359_04040 [Candidatus Brocadiales bacterium]|nr:hypothetical protein [Candidatus Brocadiales bacterium]
MRGESGVILLILVGVIGIGTVATAVIPLFFTQETTALRVEETRKEMEKIQEAIFGVPQLGYFGYMQDMGRLPMTLKQLNTQNVPGLTDQPSYSTSNTNEIGMGWRGPYVNFGFNKDDYLYDAWGNEYIYEGDDPPPNPLDPVAEGQLGKGRITSKGPDETLGTADDIMVPLARVNALGKMAVTVRVDINGDGDYVDTFDVTYLSGSGCPGGSGRERESNPSDVKVIGYFPFFGTDPLVAGEFGIPDDQSPYTWSNLPEPYDEAARRIFPQAIHAFEARWGDCVDKILVGGAYVPIEGAFGRKSKIINYPTMGGSRSFALNIYVD